VGLTDRLYYSDSYLAGFEAAITDTAGDACRVYLDRTAFYPTSGGQPNDTGTLNGIRVLDVVDEDERIVHVLESPAAPGPATCRIDWPRRFDHMQQHTGQHVLSAVLVALYGYRTVGFHLGADVSTIDITAPALEAAELNAVIERANGVVFENRPVTIGFAENSPELGLRKASEREGVLRIVSVEGLDRSACGGTHVRATGEIGSIAIRKLEKAHGSVRIEFLCGMRAVGRARADYEALAQIARTFSAPLDETPALAAAQGAALDAAEKARRKLSAELARLRGRDLYAAAAGDETGLRVHVERIARGSLDEDVRAAAQGFTAHPGAFYVAIVEEPPAVLVAASADSGIHAGNAVRQAVSSRGGRGGGNPQMAQGSVPSKIALEEAAAEILAAARSRKTA
jgi:alanyl-tRNA synthetase